VYDTYGPQARAWAAREIGIEPAPWQAYVIDNILRHDKKGDLIARNALIGCGRQNGKSIIVRVLIGWMLDEGRCLPPFQGWTEILAGAHDAKQARIIYSGVFNDLSGIKRWRDASKGGRFERTVKLTELFGIRAGNLTLDTITSQPGSVRGHSAGLVALDECLTQRDWSLYTALSPVVSAQRSPLIILTSTAGDAESIFLRQFYDRLVRQATGDEDPDPTFYGAWWQSENPDAQLDWTQIRQANPALGDGRLTDAAIRTEFGILPPDSWRRERLNHWSDTAADSAFAPGLWAACRTDQPLIGLSGPYALGVDVAPGWERATITVAGVREDQRIGVEVYRDIRGSDGSPVTADRLVAEIAAFPDPVAVIAYDGVSGAAPRFQRDAAESGRPYDELTSRTMTSACMDITEMIQSARLAVGDPLIDAQVPNVVRKAFGDMFRFTRTASTGPIDAVLAMTFAAHAIARTQMPPQIFF
jgi:hypothetical protein